MRIHPKRRSQDTAMELAGISSHGMVQIDFPSEQGEGADQFSGYLGA